MSAEASLSRCPVEHIVLYPFKNASDLNEAAVFIKSLQNSAQRTGKSYIRSIKCGSTRVSPPDRTQGTLDSGGCHIISLSPLQGYNLVSYFTFASDDDRAFFVKEDEAHQRLIKFLDGKLDKGIMVFDFIDGEAEGSVSNTS
jgi:hypothetical protein